MPKRRMANKILANWTYLKLIKYRAIKILVNWKKFFNVSSRIRKITIGKLITTKWNEKNVTPIKWIIENKRKLWKREKHSSLIIKLIRRDGKKKIEWNWILKKEIRWIWKKERIRSSRKNKWINWNSKIKVWAITI